MIIAYECQYCNEKFIVNIPDDTNIIIKNMFNFKVRLEYILHSIECSKKVKNHEL